MMQSATRTSQTAARLSLDHVWLFAGVAFIALRVLLTPIPPNDFWWHMATGRTIVATGQIPTVDSFSYTRAGEPFYNQSWLAQVLMYGIHQLGGVELLVLIQALVLVSAYGLLLRLCIRRSGAVRLSAGVLLMTTMPMSFDNWVLRPQTYVLPLFMAFVYILTVWRESDEAQTTQRLPTLLRYRLWLLPLLMVLWVNMHGSFVLGGALIALTFVGEALRRFIADHREAAAWAKRPIGTAEDVLQRPPPVQRPPLWPLFCWGGITALALLINPRGLEVLGYVRNLLSTSAVTDLVTEWAPQTTRDINGVIFFLFLFFTIGVLAYARRRPDPVDMLLAGAFLWLALGAVRNNIWFGLVVTPLLVVQLASWLPANQATRPKFQGLPIMNGVLIGIIALPLLLCLPWIKPALGLPPELGNLLDPNTPVTAVEVMAQDPARPRHLFHAMAYGSYLIWATPDQPVFIDPRIELYPFAQWQDYLWLSAGRDIGPLVEKYQIDGFLLNNVEQSGLIQALQASPSWELRYEDQWHSYFVPRRP